MIDNNSERVPTYEERRRHRRLVLLVLLLMILINIIVRYPTDHPTPLGSDTYFALKMSRSLTDYGHANWILTPWSYLGLYPLSYPSGALFEFAEYQMLTGADWNSVPWVFGMFFSVLFVLAGFVLFRMFRLGAMLSAVMAGLMALSPFFLYFTYGQASTRGFLIPLFIVGLYFVFWSGTSTYRRLSLFLVISVTGIFIHRSGMVIMLFEGLAGVIAFLTPFLFSKSIHVKRAVFGIFVALGLSFLVWPWIPGLNYLLSRISELSSTYRIAQWEFSSGTLFNGDSPLILLANLGANYVGSMGLVFLLMPVAILALYPKSRESRDRDSFLIAVLLIFAPFLWKVQYVQLLFIPFVFLVAGVVIERRRRVSALLAWLLKRVRWKQVARLRKHTRSTGRRPAISVTLLVFLVVSMLFSVYWCSHRLQNMDRYTYEMTWPSDSMLNLGSYVGAYEMEGKKGFVANSDLLARRVAWYSGWDDPVMDAAAMQADGFLNGSADSFVVKPELTRDFINFLSLFYNLNDVYDVNATAEDRDILTLTWEDSYGFFKLYYKNPTESLYSSGQVSIANLNISILVQINHLGNSLSNPFLLQGSIYSRFLAAVTADSYVIYRADDYSIYQISSPR